MNTQTTSEGLLFRVPDYRKYLPHNTLVWDSTKIIPTSYLFSHIFHTLVNDEWVPGSHVNNLFRPSNPAYSLTYRPSSSSNGCTPFNERGFVDWCQSDGLRPPDPPGSCGGAGFCSMDNIGCPLEEPASSRTCNEDNNGRSLDDVDCFGQENRWNNAVVAGVCKCLSNSNLLY